jgi:hypothetical protein
LSSGEDLRQAHQVYKFPRCFLPLLLGFQRGEIIFYFHRTTPSVNESHVASSEIFPFEKTVLMARTRKRFRKGGHGAKKTNEVPGKN